MEDPRSLGKTKSSVQLLLKSTLIKKGKKAERKSILTFEKPESESPSNTPPKVSILEDAAKEELSKDHQWREIRRSKRPEATGDLEFVGITRRRTRSVVGPSPLLDNSSSGPRPETFRALEDSFSKFDELLKRKKLHRTFVSRHTTKKTYTVSLQRPPVFRSGGLEVDVTQIKRNNKTLPSRYWMRFLEREWEHLDPAQVDHSFEHLHPGFFVLPYIPLPNPFIAEGSAPSTAHLSKPKPKRAPPPVPPEKASSSRGLNTDSPPAMRTNSPDTRSVTPGARLEPSLLPQRSISATNVPADRDRIESIPSTTITSTASTTSSNSVSSVTSSTALPVSNNTPPKRGALAESWSTFLKSTSNAPAMPAPLSPASSQTGLQTVVSPSAQPPPPRSISTSSLSAAGISSASSPVMMNVRRADRSDSHASSSDSGSPHMSPRHSPKRAPSKSNSKSNLRNIVVQPPEQPAPPAERPSSPNPDRTTSPRPKEKREKKEKKEKKEKREKKEKKEKEKREKDLKDSRDKKKQAQQKKDTRKHSTEEMQRDAIRPTASIPISTSTGSISSQSKGDSSVSSPIAVRTHHVPPLSHVDSHSSVEDMLHTTSSNDDKSSAPASPHPLSYSPRQTSILASLQEMLHTLVHAAATVSDEQQEAKEQLMNVFLVFRNYCTTAELFRTIITCWTDTTRQKLGEHAQIRQILYDSVMRWITLGFRYDFMRENGVADAESIKPLSEFMLLLPPKHQAEISQKMSELMQANYSASDVWSRPARKTPFLANLALSSLRKDDFSLINSVPLTQLSFCFTVLDLDLFTRVSRMELLARSFSSFHRHTGHAIESLLRELTTRWNAVQTWVTSEIVTTPKLKARVNVLEKFIMLAERLYLDYNLHSFFAVMFGLKDSNVSRLKLTWKNLPQPLYASFQRMDRLTDLGNGYKAYRSSLKEIRRQQPAAPILPFVAVPISDLVMMGGVPDHETGGGEVNVRKMLNVGKIISDFESTQTLCRTRLANMQWSERDVMIMKLLPSTNVERYQKITDDFLYDQSKFVEPSTIV